MIELVQHKIGHPFGNAGFLEGGISQGTLYLGLGHLKYASSQKLEEVEVNLLRVRVFFFVDAHKEVFDINNDAQ